MLKTIKIGVHIALKINKNIFKIKFIISIENFKNIGLIKRLYNNILIKIPKIKNILICPLFWQRVIKNIMIDIKSQYMISSIFIKKLLCKIYFLNILRKSYKNPKIKPIHSDIKNILN